MIAAVVLAAGAGVRAGGPKALRHTADGEPWIVRAVNALRAGGCDEVIVVLGAKAERAAQLVPGGARTVVAEDWANGVSASLRAGLAAAGHAEVAVLTLVDLPGLPASAVARLASGAGPTTLRRAVYDGRPGHPVVLGRDHWAPLLREAAGDVGAGPYLRRRGAKRVECGDLWDGADIDVP